MRWHRRATVIGYSCELQQLGVKLRLQRADRNELTIGAFIHAVIISPAVQQIFAVLAPHPQGMHPVYHRGEQSRTIHHRSIHHLPYAISPNRFQRTDQSERQQQPASAEISEIVHRRHRRLPSRANRGKHPRQSNVVDVVSCGLCIGTFLPPAGHAPIDETRIAGSAHIWPDAQPLGYPRAKSFQQNVGRLNQLQHHFHTRRVFQIHPHRATPPVEQIHIRLCGKLIWHFRSAIYTDHICPHIGQQHSAERTWPDASNLYDFYAC